eukprot:8381116-Karenia_brevis.AAC.1
MAPESSREASESSRELQKGQRGPESFRWFQRAPDSSREQQRGPRVAWEGLERQFSCKFTWASFVLACLGMAGDADFM